jgi:hypothetical protein
MPRLYRNANEPLHWLVWSDEGWFRFPAKMDGWAQRSPAGHVLRHQLQRIPLRLAFNTGLLEFAQACALKRAA